jgi:hypothetical protein
MTTATIDCARARRGGCSARALCLLCIATEVVASGPAAKPKAGFAIFGWPNREAHTYEQQYGEHRRFGIGTRSRLMSLCIRTCGAAALIGSLWRNSKRGLLRALLVVIALGVGSAAHSAEPSHVVIDPSDQHTTTFVGVPKTLPEKEFDALKQSLAQRKGAYMLTWQEFKLESEKHVRSHIRRNDYPDVDIVDGVTRLLERYDGSPFGLTWNGGIAVTQNDYTHSAREYRVFLDPRRDPVHPLNHLEPLLSR